MWWGHPYGFAFFPLVFPFGIFGFVVLCFIIARIIFFRRFRRSGDGYCGPMYGPWNREGGADAVLKQRLAKGDITEDEYNHIREILKD
ncbi:hypothetical protein JZ785_25535 [Alicyclobacillus curvatus]|jgi:uncharacterized membrane protein|nr:hypothetical protein JZ785_25535 [Alicyclobacillus curvatus]